MVNKKYSINVNSEKVFVNHILIVGKGREEPSGIVRAQPPTLLASYGGDINSCSAAAIILSLYSYKKSFKILGEAFVHWYEDQPVATMIFFCQKIMALSRRSREDFTVLNWTIR